jgi:hypothetical protein
MRSFGVDCTDSELGANSKFISSLSSQSEFLDRENNFYLFRKEAYLLVSNTVD